MVKKIVTKVAKLRAELVEAAQAGKVEEVQHISTQIQALEAGTGTTTPEGLNKGESFMLWALDQVAKDPDCIKKGWNGINTVFTPVPGYGFTVNQYLHQKLGLDKDGVIRLGADMVRKGYIGIVPKKNSVMIYPASKMPVSTQQKADFGDLPSEFE